MRKEWNSFSYDAVQSAGKELLDLKGWQVSAASLTAHKLHGPLGAGLLWLKAGVPITRLMEGGRTRTNGVPALRMPRQLRALQRQSGWLRTSIRLRLDVSSIGLKVFGRNLSSLGGVRRNGHPQQRLANTLNVSFLGLHGEDLLIALDLAGLSVSSGSACLVGSVQASHVLAAMGVPDDWAAATVRFSIGPQIRDEDLGEIVGRVRNVVERQRALRGWKPESILSLKSIQEEKEPCPTVP